MPNPKLDCRRVYYDQQRLLGIRHWDFIRHSGFVSSRCGGQLVVCLMWASLVAYFLPLDAAASPPNVVLIISDDQGYGDLGCHGNRLIQTPNLDKLHTQSIRFTNFHADPTCSPTRAALLTGRYSIRTGVWHTVMGRSLLREDELTMGEVFSRSGYRTGIFGKWHLGDNYPLRPQDRGFQEVLVHKGGGVGQTPDHWGNDYFDDTYFRNVQPEQVSGYCTDVWFDEAMKFIVADQQKPFFAYIATNAPHAPNLVADKYREPYINDDVPNAAFYGMITNLDENVGRLLKFLEAQSLSENTILIFMTDNGTAAGFRQMDKRQIGFNAGMRGTKGTPYDGGHRVPFFIRWPAGGVQGGRDVNRLAAHLDVLPTLAELCGLQIPEDRKLDGLSLVPLLRDPNATWPDRTLVVDSQRIERPEKGRASCVMTDRWRLIDGKSLFDINADPGQQRDLASQHPQIAGELRSAYDRWWDDVSAQFDDYVEISVGSDHENPAVLNSMDWHETGKLPPWNQPTIAEGIAANGFWAVRVEHDGRYEFHLRRWPEELDEPINGGPGMSINAATARLAIGDFDETREVAEGASSVVFVTELKAGNSRLQTWFTSPDGTLRGAYYVKVKRLSGL
jgi:arylsulfatase A-like enzyme